MKYEKNLFEVDTALIDVDGTLTETDETGGRTIDGLELLIELFCNKYTVSREMAEKQIFAVYNPALQCVSEVLPQLGLEKSELWTPLLNDCRQHTQITEDADYFLKELKKKQIRVYTASTNSRFMTCLKLTIKGLASMDGTQYITGFYPGNFFADPNGKFAPDYFAKIIRHGNFDPHRTMMVGDDPVRDLYPALAAGISRCFIVDRSQQEKWVEKNGGIFVNSLIHIVKSCHCRIRK